MQIGSQELIDARREEIVAACAKLYQTMSFKEITLKDIGRETSFTRTSIYNYFRTKEEIFLAFLQREYDSWAAELDGLTAGRGEMTRDELADALARSLAKRPQMLKLLSMNHFDMEANSRPEILTEFKRAFGGTMKAVRRALDKFCPGMTDGEKRDFIYAYFPFIYGIYPYTFISDEQRRSMDEAAVGFVEHSVYELAYKCAKKLLGGEGGAG